MVSLSLSRRKLLSRCFRRGQLPSRATESRSRRSGPKKIATNSMLARITQRICDVGYRGARGNQMGQTLRSRSEDQVSLKNVQFISHLDPPANGQAVIYLTGLLEVFISELSIFGNSIGQLCPLSSHQCGQKIENKHKWSKKGNQTTKGWKVKVKK